jgi:transcriptional regulator with XRE-family HTH domain
MADDSSDEPADALGRFIHAQRKLAKLSLRELAGMSEISNAYLSQLERGMHQPSMKVVTQMARALGLPVETFLTQAGLIDEDQPEPGAAAPEAPSAEAAIKADPNLTDAQREALLAVLRSFEK